MKRHFIGIIVGTTLAIQPATADQLEQRMGQFEATNPMPDPAPAPFRNTGEMPRWIQECTAAQEKYNRWDLARFEYGIQKFNPYRKAGARNAYFSMAEQTNPPAATCSCLAEKRASAFASMGLEAANALISSQYQRCRKLGS